MKRLTNSVLITSLATILAFLSVTYISCTKAPTLSPTSCENHVCLNGGYCKLAVCVCPTGYTDTACGTAFNTKFNGTWSVTQYVAQSDVPSAVGTTKTYNVTISSAASPTAIVINGLTGNVRFTNIIADIDSTNNSLFNIQPYTPTDNGNFHIEMGYATIDGSNRTIGGTYYTNNRDDFGNLENDVLNFTMTKLQ